MYPYLLISLFVCLLSPDAEKGVMSIHCNYIPFNVKPLDGVKNAEAQKQGSLDF